MQEITYKRFSFLQNFNQKGEALPRIPLRKVFLSSFAINLFTLALVFVAQKYLPPELPLFYGLPQGEDQLAPTHGLFIPGFFSLIINLINTLIILTVKEDFLRKTLIFASLAVSLFSLTTSIKIILLVGSFKY